VSEAETPIPASDFSTRFAMGVVMVAVACVAIYVGGWPFRILVVLGASVMLLEWSDMHRVKRLWGYVGMMLMAVSLIGAAEWLFPAGEMDEALSSASFDPAWLGFAICAALALLVGLLSRRVTMVGGFLYVAVPSFALIVLEWAWLGLVFWVMIVTWATDIFAFFAGRSIGGPKLAPGISPNKTWAGLIGGVIGAAILGYFTANYFELGRPFVWIGGVMALLAQAGDLYESWLKRRAGVKDSGTILPGHGGALDRLDGLLPVIVATFLILVSGQWTGCTAPFAPSQSWERRDRWDNRRST
jgi:phosphatidate cytidylyltransferase